MQHMFMGPTDIRVRMLNSHRTDTLGNNRLDCTKSVNAPLTQSMSCAQTIIIQGPDACDLAKTLEQKCTTYNPMRNELVYLRGISGVSIAASAVIRLGAAVSMLHRSARRNSSPVAKDTCEAARSCIRSWALQKLILSCSCQPLITSFLKVRCLQPRLSTLQPPSFPSSDHDGSLYISGITAVVRYANLSYALRECGQY